MEPFQPERLESALTRHPAAWYIPFIAGVHFSKTKSQNPLPWFARALAIDPHAPKAHYYVGKTLLERGLVSQAMLELRLAARHNPSMAKPAAQLLVARAPSFTTLAPIATHRSEQLLLWDAL